MACPHCESTATTRRTCRAALGYRRFNCRSCRRRFNERTSTPFNDLQSWGCNIPPALRGTKTRSARDLKLTIVVGGGGI